MLQSQFCCAFPIFHAQESSKIFWCCALFSIDVRVRQLSGMHATKADIFCFALGLLEYISTEVSTSKQKKFPLVTFVDTPGLVDGDMNYPFDVNEAILWLGNLVDLIFVFFDPIGQVYVKANPFERQRTPSFLKAALLSSPLIPSYFRLLLPFPL